MKCPKFRYEEYNRSLQVHIDGLWVDIIWLPVKALPVSKRRKQILNQIVHAMNCHEKLVNACKIFDEFAAKDIPKDVKIPEEWLLELKNATKPITEALAEAGEKE